MKDKVIFKVQDNWDEFVVYDKNRLLDSLASIFHVQSPCAAVALYDSALYISYNTHITKTDKFTTSLTTLLKDQLLKNDRDLLFSLHLLTNRDFTEFIGQQISHEKNSEARLFLERFRDKASLLKSSLYSDVIKGADDFSKCLEIIPIYFEIYNYCNTKSHEKWIIEKLIRPLQDVYKAFYALPGSQPFNEIHILSNKKGLHAECNILDQLDFIKYVGISKLSCALCHKYLSDSSHEHRGTHGLLDKILKKFIKPLQKESFEDFFIKTGKELKSGDDISGNRKISIDEFEKKIFVDKKKSLWDFKEKMGFIKKSKTDITNNLSIKKQERYINNDDLGKNNAFNKQDDNEYLYQNHDIIRIQKQLFSDDKLKNNFTIAEPFRIGDRENIEQFIQTILTSNEPIVGCFNPTGLHWVAFCIVKNNEMKLTLYYKDSQGAAPDVLEGILKNHFKEKELTKSYSSSNEQTYGVECGIFAMSNVLKIANKYDHTSNTIENFNDIEWCDLGTAVQYRKVNYANLYIKQVTLEEKQSILEHELRKKIVEHHIKEAKNLVEYLITQETLQDFLFQYIRLDEDPITFLNGSEEKVVCVEIATTQSIDLSNSNYDYCYRFHWSKNNDINVNIIKQYLGNNELEELEGDHSKYQILASKIDIEEINKLDKINLSQEKKGLEKDLGDAESQLYKKFQEQLKYANVIQYNGYDPKYKDGLKEKDIEYNLKQLKELQQHYKSKITMSNKIINNDNVLDNLTKWITKFKNGEEYVSIIGVKNDNELHACVIQVTKNSQQLQINIIDPLSEKDSEFTTQLNELKRSVEKELSQYVDSVQCNVIYSGMQDKNYGTCGDMCLIMIQQLIVGESAAYQLTNDSDTNSNNEILDQFNYTSSSHNEYYDIGLAGDVAA